MGVEVPFYDKDAPERPCEHEGDEECLRSGMDEVAEFLKINLEHGGQALLAL